MSFIITTVSGIVIAVHNIGEASRNIDLFTREYGLLRITVQSARNSKKLASISQWMAVGDFDIVRTSHGGRLIGGVVQVSVVNCSALVLRACANTCAYLNRFIQGESSHPELFDWFIYTFLSDIVQPDTPDTIRNTVRSAKIFILGALGYLSYADPAMVTDSDIAQAETVSLL